MMDPMNPQDSSMNVYHWWSIDIRWCEIGSPREREKWLRCEDPILGIRNDQPSANSNNPGEIFDRTAATANNPEGSWQCAEALSGLPE
jgi:hypothetical protein